MIVAPADWSGLPRDLYVTSVRRLDTVVWEATLCSVPMAIGPEVRYLLASQTTEPAVWQHRYRAVHKDGTVYGWSKWLHGRAPESSSEGFQVEERPLYEHPPAAPLRPLSVTVRIVRSDPDQPEYVEEVIAGLTERAIKAEADLATEREITAGLTWAIERLQSEKGLQLSDSFPENWNELSKVVQKAMARFWLAMAQRERASMEQADEALRGVLRACFSADDDVQSEALAVVRQVVAGTAIQKRNTV